MLNNIISVDVDEKYFEAKIKLCKPNRKAIDNMAYIKNRVLHVKLGNINELSFDIPYSISRNHEVVKNPLLDKIKLGFLVKLDYKGRQEYFIFMNDSKSMDSDSENISYTLKSLAYRLSKYDVRELEFESEILSVIASEILSETNWSLGTVDVDFDLMYRSISISTSTVLQSIFDIAEKFGAIPDFDTVNKKVNFIKLESTGIDRGFKAREGKYLEDYSIETSLDEIVTRLKCYGEEGLEFRNLSPTGSNYIQDFSYFTYPFECDSDYNVLKSSDYGMSDELCIALTKYDKLLQIKTNEFNILTQNKTSTEDEIVQRQQELSVLTTEMKTYENELDLINTTYGENATSRQDWIDVNAKIDAKQIEINNKNTEISNLEITLANIKTQISDLGTLLSTENNFTTSQIDELHDYIYVKEFSDTSIAYEEDLLKAGVEVFNKYREPMVTLNFNIVDFTNDFQFKADRKKINLGDITTFNSKRFNMNIKTRITEITYNLDEQDINLVISNDIENNSVEDIIANLLNNVNSTSMTLDMNLYKLDMAKNADTLVNQMLTSAFDTGKNILLGGLNNTNEMTERGFYSRDINDPDKTFLVINGGMFAITKDGGRSVEVAINKDGVFANRLVGRMILSNKLLIDSESGVVTIEDNTMTIRDSSNNKLVELGRYQNPDDITQYKHGLRIYDGAIDIRTSDNQYRGMQMDSNGLRAFNNNGVKTFEIDATYGDLFFMGDIESSTITGSTIQTVDTANRGIKINNDGLSLYNTSGTRTVYLNANTGDANFTGTINASTIYGTNINGGTINGTSIIGGNLNIGNGAFVVNSDGSAIMTKATISTSAVKGRYINMNGSKIEGGNFTYGSSYILGTAELSGFNSYRSGILQLDDYNCDVSSTINRRMQLVTNSIMVQGSNLVLGGSSENRSTIIARKVLNTYHSLSVQSDCSLYVSGGIYTTGSVYSNGSQLATINYVDTAIANALASSGA